MFHTGCLHPPSAVEMPSVMEKALGEVLLEKPSAPFQPWKGLLPAQHTPRHHQQGPQALLGRRCLCFSIPQEKQVSPVQPAPRQPVAISTQGKVF